MDKVVVVNEHDEEIGVMPKEQAHADGTPHRIAVTYVEDGMGKFLVQVRMSGTLDHSSAGHVHPGETYEEAARRELEEELGISNVALTRIGHGVTLNEVAPHDGGVRTHVFDVFTCVAEPGRLQEDEVKGVFWAVPDEILADMSNSETEARYAGGFITSLPIYISSKQI